MSGEKKRSGNDMKGLIYKEMLLSRRNIGLSLIYSLLFSSVFILVRLSMICGNLAYDEEAVLSLTKNMYLFRYFPCIVFMLGFANSGCNVYADISSGWLRFCKTTAIKENTIIISKMLSLFILSFCAMLLSLLHSLILSAVGGDRISFRHFIIILVLFNYILGFFLLSNTSDLVFKKKGIVQLVLMAVAGAAGAVRAMPILESEEAVSEDFDLFGYILQQIESKWDFIIIGSFILIIMGALVSYFVSVEALKRREY